MDKFKVLCKVYLLEYYHLWVGLVGFGHRYLLKNLVESNLFKY